MRKNKFPPFVGVLWLCCLWGVSEGARTTSITVGSSNGGVGVDNKEGSTHRQYSHQLDSGSSISYGTNNNNNNNKAVNGNLGSGDEGSGRNGFSSQSGGASSSSVEYGGVAEGTGSFHSLVRIKEKESLKKKRF
jgi:hypothetical protein